MKTQPKDQSLLINAGWSYEYPGYWEKHYVDKGYVVTIADGVGCNNYPWETQIASDDGQVEACSEGFNSPSEAIAFADSWVQRT